MSQQQPFKSLWLVLKRWCGNTRLDEKSWDNVKWQCLNNVFTLFHCAEKHWLWALKCDERYSRFIGLTFKLY
jgi:hypothetical protein